MTNSFLEQSKNGDYLDQQKHRLTVNITKGDDSDFPPQFH